MNDRAPQCANCDASLDSEAEYCPACGQKRAGLPTVRELFAQFFDDVLSIDSKFVRTYVALVARPGRLTQDYLAGRRQRFMRPLRVYLLNSLLMFLTVAWMGSDAVQLGTSAGGDPDAAVDDRIAFSLRGFGDDDERARLREVLMDAGADSAWTASLVPLDSLESLADDVQMPVFGERFRRQIQRVERMDADELDAATNDAMVRNLPKALFLLVPVHAFILGLIYRRRRRRYAEHFVFSLHTHAFVFLAFGVLNSFDETAVEIVLLTAVAAHGWLSLKRVYAQGWFKTTVKAVLLTGAYLVVFLPTVFMSFLISLLTV